MVRGASGQLLREHMRNPCHLNLHQHTGHGKMPMRQDCCARTPQAHLDLSPCAKLQVLAKRLLRSHAVSKKDFSPGANCKGKLHSAFARPEHTWISLRAQTDMFRRIV